MQIESSFRSRKFFKRTEGSKSRLLVHYSILPVSFFFIVCIIRLMISCEVKGTFSHSRVSTSIDRFSGIHTKQSVVMETSSPSIPCPTGFLSYISKKRESKKESLFFHFFINIFSVATFVRTYVFIWLRLRHFAIQHVSSFVWS